MKWEFTIAEFSNSLSTESLEAKLDMYGYNGWDLISVINYGENNKFFFKRELELEE